MANLLNKYEPTDMGVVVRITTSVYERRDTFVHERTMRVLKRKSNPESSEMFEMDCSEGDFTDMVQLPEEDGLYRVIIHPTSYDFEMPHVLDEWHYTFEPYTEEPS